MFGIARERAIGAKIRDVIIPERQRAAHDAGMTRYLRTGDSRILNRRIEVTALRGGGRVPRRADGHLNPGRRAHTLYRACPRSDAAEGGGA
jgi:hypothetical protein